MQNLLPLYLELHNQETLQIVLLLQQQLVHEVILILTLRSTHMVALRRLLIERVVVLFGVILLLVSPLLLLHDLLLLQVLPLELVELQKQYILIILSLTHNFDLLSLLVPLPTIIIVSILLELDNLSTWLIQIRRHELLPISFIHSLEFFNGTESQ